MTDRSNHARGQEGLLWLAGPPWIETIMGDRLPGSKEDGNRSQPCTSRPSHVHWIVSAFPQRGFRPLLAVVFGSQAPIGPEHTSGGRAHEDRMTAARFPSAETD